MQKMRTGKSQRDDGAHASAMCEEIQLAFKQDSWETGINPFSYTRCSLVSFSARTMQKPDNTNKDCLTGQFSSLFGNQLQKVSKGLGSS